MEASLHPNESIVVKKTVTTPAIPPNVEVCQLVDETGSFGDDIFNLKAAAPGLYDTVVAASPGAKFGGAGFRDYPVSPYGSSDDWVYRLLSTIDTGKDAWLTGVNALSASGGADIPEAQFDAIVAALQGINDPTLGKQNPCGFSADESVTRVLVVATDAPFHVPGLGDPHVYDQAATIAALQSAKVTVVGLKGPGAELELDALATATGGSVQAITADGANIGNAIVEGLKNVSIKVSMTSNCEDPISTAFKPAEQVVVSGDPAVFKEIIKVANTAVPSPKPYECQDWALINGKPMTDDKGKIIYEQKKITVLDGRMTGGGSVFTQEGGRVTHGFQLHCASVLVPNNLQINWGKGDKFKLDKLTYAKCSDTKGIGEENPVAGFDTLRGRGTGEYNKGIPAVVKFEFVDSGEPGKFDSAYIEVIAGGKTVLKANGTLNNGNHQAHP